MPQALPIYPKTIFFDFGSKGFAVDTQNSGCLLALAFGAAEDKLNISLFKLLQGEPFFGKYLEFTLSLGNDGWKMLGFNNFAIFQNQDALDGVL
jgi:hypothetical protein